MNTLVVPAAAPGLIHAGAAIILWLHIAGGRLAMASGAAALAFRKGSPWLSVPPPAARAPMVFRLAKPGGVGLFGRAAA